MSEVSSHGRVQLKNSRSVEVDDHRSARCHQLVEVLGVTDGPQLGRDDIAVTFVLYGGCMAGASYVFLR